MGFINNILQKIKENTLDKTNIDEQIVGGIKNLLGGANKTINTAGQNLNAWKTVATQPATRNDYVQNVITPSLPKLPTYSQSNPSPAAKLARRLESIKQTAAPVVTPVITSLKKGFDAQNEFKYGKVNPNTGINDFSTSFLGKGISAIKTGANNVVENMKSIANPDTAKELTVDANPAQQYIANRYTAPIAQIPHNLDQIFGRKKTLGERGMGALGLLGGVATLVPDPIQDIAMPGYDYIKGVKKAQLEGKSLPEALKSRTAIDSLTGQDTAGLGDAITTDETGKTIGNIAELPLMMGLFGGKKAKGWDELKNGQFSSLTDKMTRFEISDKNVKTLIPRAMEGFSLKLNQIMNHDELFKNYPELANMPVTSKKLANGVMGMFDGKEITLDKNFLLHPTAYNTGKIITPSGQSINLQFSKYTTSRDKIKATLLHEVQHAIQGIEDFATGGSPDSVKLTPEQIKSISKVIDDNKRTIDFYNEVLNSSDPVIEKNRQLSGFNGNLTEYKNLLAKQIYDLSDDNRRLYDYPISQADKAKNYQKLAGEVEARDVESRMNLTPEERARIQPGSSQGIPVNEQIIKKGTGISNSIPTKLPTRESINTVYDALKSGDKEAAAALHAEFSKEFKMPDFQKMVDNVDLESPFAKSRQLKSKIDEIKTNAQGVAQEQRAPFDGNTIGRAKQIINSRTYQEGDLESVRAKLSPAEQAKISDMIESVRTTLGDPQMTEKDAIEYLGNLPNKIDTIPHRNPEIKTMTQKANELENGLEIRRDDQGNIISATATKIPNTKEEKIMAEKAAKTDFDNWQKEMFKQEGAVLTPKANETRVLKDAIGKIKKSTVSPLAAKVDEMKDLSGFMGQARDVYRNFKAVFGKNYDTAKKMILDPFDKSKGKFIDDQKTWLSDLDNNIVKGMGIKKGSAESAAIQEFGEGNRDLASLVKEFGDAKAKQIVQADGWFRQTYNKLLDEVNAARAIIYPGNPEKQIPKRDDYYRHFTEMADGFQGLKNIFENPAGISSKLAGISPNTKPKSKWLSFAQKRLGVKTDIDAVGGFLNYVNAASYAKNIDPQISRFRDLAGELATVTEEGTPNAGKVNNFIEYLNDFANDLSGKTNEMDRWFQKVVPGGRKTFKAINWLNNRVKANTILANVSSSIAQISNIPQGIADAGIKNAAPAVGDTLLSIFKENKPMAESTFLKERFFNGFDKFDTGLIDNAKNFAAWMVGALDQVGTKYIWNAEYRRALGEGVENAVKFADDRTRNMVAGRGIGEVPLIQKSKMFQLVAPFQLEVGNLWYVMKDWVSAKEFGKLATFAVGSYMLNKAQEQIRGSGVSLDPIQAMVDAYQAYSEEDDKKKGLIKAGGRLAGEVLSNVPLGQTAAAAYPEYGMTVAGTKLPTRKDLFGRNDPTRFGSGLVAMKGLQDPLYKVLPPFGGSQAKKTIQGIKTMVQGYKEGATGKVQDVVDQTAGNYIKGALFGKGAIKGVNAAGGEQGSTFGEKQSEVIKNSGNMKETAQSFIMTREKQAQLDKARASIKNSSGSVKTVGNDIVYNDGGEVKTIYVDRITTMPSGTEYEKAKKNAAAYKVVDDVMNIQDMPDADKEEIITKKLGLDVKEVSYYIVAKDTADEKTGYVKDVISKAKDPFETLVGMRKTVNDKRILSDDVIDNLVDSGDLNKDQAKALKAVKYSQSKGLYDSSIDSRNKKAASASKAQLKAILAKYKDISDSKLALNKKLTSSSMEKKPMSKNLRDILAKRRSSNSSSVTDKMLSNIKKRTTITPLRK